MPLYSFFQQAGDESSDENYILVYREKFKTGQNAMAKTISLSKQLWAGKFKTFESDEGRKLTRGKNITAQSSLMNCLMSVVLSLFSMGSPQFDVCHCFSVLQWEAFSLPELNNFLRVLDREESEYMTELKHKYKFMKKIVQTRLKELRIERQQAAGKKRDSYIQPAGPDHPLAQSS